jgi:hypothetical protein
MELDTTHAHLFDVMLNNAVAADFSPHCIDRQNPIILPGVPSSTSRSCRFDRCNRTRC